MIVAAYIWAAISVVVLSGMFLYETGIIGMVQAFIKEVRHRP